jgi:hypothetical protein
MGWAYRKPSPEKSKKLDMYSFSALSGLAQPMFFNLWRREKDDVSMEYGVDVTGLQIA